MPEFRKAVISAIVDRIHPIRVIVMRVSIPVLYGFIALLSCTSAMAAKVYKWTDEKGITHFSEHPPLNTKTTVVKPQIALGEYSEASSEAASSSGATSSKAATAAAERAAALKDPQRCQDARSNLETLKTYTHIKVKEDNGEYRYITPDEQAQKIKEAAKAAEESCQ